MGFEHGGSLKESIYILIYEKVVQKSESEPWFARNEEIYLS